MLDQEIINEQLALLAANRRTLAHLIEQAAQFGGEVFASPQTANGISQARSEIAHIKAIVRENGVQVEDEPNDDPPPQIEPTQRIAGDVVMGDKVDGDKVMGDKHVHIAQPALAPALHQLRAPVADFVGREREIEQLVTVLRRAATGEAAAVISGVRGMGGVGKTELAYKVAHELRETFLDGMLLIELRGATSPLTPKQALQSLLTTTEPHIEPPDDLGQLQVLYRAKLSGKRMLVVADDAADVRQVRPLMPPAGCALMVTSRNRFSLPGMVTLDLEILPANAAEKLLLSICPRIAEHAARLAQLCGYLPLALRVSASLLRENTSRDVERYLEQLEQERLKHLSDPDNQDDPAASVEASLRLSFEALEPSAQIALVAVFALLKDLPELVEPKVITSISFTISNQGIQVILRGRAGTWNLRPDSGFEMMLSPTSDPLIRPEQLEYLQRRCFVDYYGEAFRLHDLVAEFISAHQMRKHP